MRIKELSLEIKTLGKARLRSGVYIYIGSAQGPGGLGARIGRYLHGPAKTRWHIDYIVRRRDLVEILGAVFAITKRRRLEPLLFKELSRLGFMIMIEGFGSTDYGRKGYSHLLKAPTEELNQVISL
ncbi:MAG: hypothetical protein DRM97_06350, partial [Thermoprotei archaeon]